MKRAILFATAACVLLAAPHAAAQSGSLTADDYIEIQQLYARYAHTLDLGDAEGFANTFTADGEFSGAQGFEQLKAFAEGFMQNFDGAARHWNSQVVVTPTAAGADGSAYLLLVDTRTQPAGITVAGVYADKIVKTADGWRFSRRVFHIDAPTGSDQ